MANEFPQGLYVVLATKDGVTEQWVAATRAKEARVAVQLQTGREWQVVVTDIPMTVTEAKRLGLRPGDVRRLEEGRLVGGHGQVRKGSAPD